jgi:hypothetical protein
LNLSEGIQYKPNYIPIKKDLDNKDYELAIDYCVKSVEQSKIILGDFNKPFILPSQD